MAITSHIGCIMQRHDHEQRISICKCLTHHATVASDSTGGAPEIRNQEQNRSRGQV
jgi:hypothetical protein